LRPGCGRFGPWGRGRTLGGCCSGPTRRSPIEPRVADGKSLGVLIRAIAQTSFLIPMSLVAHNTAYDFTVVYVDDLTTAENECGSGGLKPN
jgi:hypothetical protein